MRFAFTTLRARLIASSVLAMIVLIAVFAPWLAPHDPLTQSVLQANLGPSPEKTPC